ncbi:hypothetical protein Cpap_1841 [Ruminiclostridium papyrosolvens DSM 2782]|uniref:Lipoprotein n=1 Tax=Ruminiclostridium papyrosolvens DSM 2782 TaxID=588581 RepID=F1TDK8_9FIRM|nr:hypothetical protein [Ruminiclostridium papyrosolvens]EGD47646.1 hypothetical protein Cpap_1841 [Ruminiclostridium papyrosolvens DSM 2782]WES36410.1 hypothetical protein P0092_10725 [Ruminiclostridium papyrosolvens DSM 2782]
MIQKKIKAVILIVILFLSGCLVTFIGFFKGRDIAISVSRPKGASGWTTSQELMTSCTYFPIVIGVSIIILSLMLSTVLFMQWINKSN